MIQIKELKLDLANNYGETGLIKISYKDKPDFEGYVHSMIDSTLDFTLIKHVVPNGGNPYCNLDFENAIQVVVKFNNGNTKIYQ